MAGFRVSNTARADLLDIGRYTQEQWGREQRQRYLDGIGDQFKSLSLSPKIAPERGDFEPPVRIFHHEKHLIIYVIEDQGILIIRVLHENMDVPAHLSH